MRPQAVPPEGTRSLVRLQAGDVRGIEGRPVEVQVDLCRQGDAKFSIVGLAGRSTRESRERLQAAIRNSGYPFPRVKILVNLAPATQEKEGAGFDLAVAIGILLASGAVGPAVGAAAVRRLGRMGFLGELGLEGEVRPVRGALLMADVLRRQGVGEVIVPLDNAEEVSLLEGLTVYGVAHLRQAVGVLAEAVDPYRPEGGGARRRGPAEERLDFADVRGQEATKRGLLVAAAGRHNLLLAGPPGVGKTMLARRLAGILPDLSLEEAMEVLRVRSVLEGERGSRLSLRPPFRAPHHTVSYTGLVGGGSHLTPGEVSRAHRGVLFLDEFPEFSRRVLEALREPLEEGSITVGRATGAATFPARFLLVAAMNPCPCGYSGHPRRACRCTPREVATYSRRISGPLYDRLDLFLHVPALDPEHLVGGPRAGGLDSAAMAARVLEARSGQEARWRCRTTNSSIPLAQLLREGRIASGALDLLRRHAERLALSARGFARALRVARTIADLEARETAGEAHVLEALVYREAVDGSGGAGA